MMYREGLEVIYLAYKPDDRFFCSIGRMAKQKRKPDVISVYLTVEDDDPAVTGSDMSADDTGFEEKVRGICTDTGCVRVIYVKKSEFGHGRTRQLGMDSSEYDRVLLITQDAVPCNKNLTFELDKALDHKDAAVAYARQKAYPEADNVEKLYRRFNYPDESRSKSASDIEKIGIKAFFCSDVCCMYKHELFDRLGGFDTGLNFNEDSIYAFHALKAGYTVEYSADAMVYHSHNDSFRQKFLRSRDLARSHKENPEVFSGISSENEGMKFFTGAFKYLIRKRDIKGTASLVSNCAAKYLGYFAGKHF